MKAVDIKNFADLPLSAPTLKGLEASHFKVLTDIQSKALPIALKGRDILGAAKTGSGKTLAFLVPVLENLYRQRWTDLDGLGALIVSPTWELATQIFEVLRKVGRYHNFSAGLVTGGKDLQQERERISRMNILVCTPGRMQQHLEQAAAFETGNLQMLVLDEADRVMDMGFQSTVDAIIEYLPKERQTLLFSATQTKKVSDLSRLSLKDPEYIAVHETASAATPSSLKEHYIITPLPEKLNTLWSFLRANLKSKIIVFLSSTKEVKFVYEAFRRMQPGIPLLQLHGNKKHGARHEITTKFSSAKASCLFSTDVAARGIDFPAVDWVVQFDAPEDAETYIHRVGRTARYQRAGRAVLFLDPSEEEGMLKRLVQKKIPIEKLNVRQKKQQSIQNQLQNMCFQDPELKYLGQKAFVTYARSIYVQKDKEVFDMKKYDFEGFSASLGLPGAPKIKFQKGEDSKKMKNAPRAAMDTSDEDDSDEDEDGKQKPKKEKEVRTRYDRMFERRNQDVLSSHYSNLITEGDDGAKENPHADADEDDDFLAVKRVHKVDDDAEDSEQEADETNGYKPKVVTGIGKEPLIIDSKRREKLLKSKKKLLKLKDKGTKLVYDDDGVAHEIYELEDEEDFLKRGPVEEQIAKFVEEEGARVKEADVEDKQLAKDKKREKKLKRKERERAEMEGSGRGREATSLAADADDDEDPLALLASLPIAGKDEGELEAERPAKRPKKWFEHDSDDEQEKKKSKRGRRVIEAADEPETLEDLEALAAGLLG